MTRGARRYGATGLFGGVEGEPEGWGGRYVARETGFADGDPFDRLTAQNVAPECDEYVMAARLADCVADSVSGVRRDAEIRGRTCYQEPQNRANGYGISESPSGSSTGTTSSGFDLWKP